MSLVRLLPAWLHAVADYAVALSLIVVALVVGGPGKAVAAGVVIGAVVLVVSLLTRYPLGVVKVLPFKVHSAADYLAVALLVASPFALGFRHSARGLTIFYIGAGIAVLLVSLITNYQYGPTAQAAAARGSQKGRANAAPADDRAEADRWLGAAAQARQPSYPPQAAPQQPSYATDAPAAPSYPPQAAPQQPSYAPEPSYAAQPAARPSYALQAAPEPAAPPVAAAESWRTASWQANALVTVPRTTPPPVRATIFPPATAVPPAAAFAPAPAYLPDAAANPVAPSAAPAASPEPVPDSRPLREILAEQRAARRSAA